MCRKSTLGFLLGAALLLVGILPAQVASEWRHIGNSAMDFGLASVAAGPVDRVWFTPDGAGLFALTHSGKTLESLDLQRWQLVAIAVPPPAGNAEAYSLPESGSEVRQAPGGTRLYAMGEYVYSSDDGGLTWTNLTKFHGISLIGGNLRDLAVSPDNPDELAVAAGTGIWHSADGGLSWSGLNQFLPNLPVKQILTVPNGVTGLRIALRADDLPENAAPELEWAPGEREAWRITGGAEITAQNQLKSELSQRLHAAITSVAVSGTYVYAGGSDGRIWVSPDGGSAFGPPSDRLSAPVEAIYADPQDPRIALAALGMGASGGASRTAHVFRTMNGGVFWDAIGANLPDVAANGITADPDSGAIYVATGAGVFWTAADLRVAGGAGNWIFVSSGLPLAAASDVRLDTGGNQLFVAVEGYGVYVEIAPHRLQSARVVNAADYSSRPAAPGGLLTVLGASVATATVETGQTPPLSAPVLAVSENASQIQVPFEASGPALSLQLSSRGRQFTLGLPLKSASPAIFVDPSGAPLILDASSGLLLDASTPAHAGSRIQILATGLGRVQPDWPAGRAAPAGDTPRVAAPVRVLLGSTPLAVKQAVLAPGYIGFYLVEADLPPVVNSGMAGLSIEVGGQTSNVVPLYLEP